MITCKQRNIFIQCKKARNSAIYEQNCENVCSKIKKNIQLAGNKKKNKFLCKKAKNGLNNSKQAKLNFWLL